MGDKNYRNYNIFHFSRGDNSFDSYFLALAVEAYLLKNISKKNYHFYRSHKDTPMLIFRLKLLIEVLIARRVWPHHQNLAFQKGC